MTVTELLEHQWLNEGTVPDVPLDTPSIIVSDEVCHSEFDTVRLSPWCMTRKKTTGKNGRAKSWEPGARFSSLGLLAVMFSSRFICERTRRSKRRGTTRSLWRL